jgi:hypothetical protein
MSNEVERSRDGRWLPGKSGNPSGRPPSRKNQITVLKQDLEIAIRDGLKKKDINDIVQSMVTLAKTGSVQAAKLVLDKTISNARDVEDVQKDGGGVRVVIENITVGRETETIEAEDADYEEIEET